MCQPSVLYSLAIVRMFLTGTGSGRRIGIGTRIGIVI